jgi:periplasmic divalent cation tolerance protein
MIYVFFTCKDHLEAKKIIKELLSSRLIACATIFPTVESIFRFEGKVEEALETKVLLKTQKDHFDAICQVILSIGSYLVPEIVAIDILTCYPPYLKWLISESTS